MQTKASILMRYSVFLILIIFLLPAPCPAQDPARDADERRYRVELIVLTHLSHDERPREEQWLQDYTEALDFLSPPTGEKEAEEAGEAESAVSAVPAQPIDPAGVDGPATDEEDTEDPLNAVLHLPELGAEMAEAWRRLRLSGPFRPVQYLAWEQAASAPFPLLRIHDRELILEQDPWAEQRLAESADEAAETASESGVAQAASETPEDAVIDALPPPLRFYRLDGTAQLTRSRFLHLALDIAWREPVFDSPAGIPPRAGEGGPAVDSSAESSPPVADAYLVYRLQQRRQVRTGRIEYFDGPVLGVLARVSRVEVAAPGFDDRDR